MATRFRSGRHWGLEGAWVVLAVVAHAAFIAGMPQLPERFGVATLRDSVDMSFLEADAEPGIVAQPEPVEPPPARKRLRAGKRPSSAKAAPAGTPQEAPVESDQLVLADEDGASSWSVEQASGVADGGGPGSGARFYVSDLSREPGTLAWDRTFARSSQENASVARDQGEAFVRLQVGADGVPSDWQVTSEDPRGFALGSACIEALKEEAWEAELDENGRPITARVVYRCGFEVSR